MKSLSAALLFIVGLLNALPLVGVLGAERLATLYGITTDDANLLLLLQHRALLFGLLGGFMMAAAFRPALRSAAVLGGLISMLGFVALAGLTGEHNPAIERIVAIDVVLSVVLLPVAALASYNFAISRSRTS